MREVVITPLLLGVLLLLTCPAAAFFRLPSPWGYKCVESKCVKELNTGVGNLITLNQCKLTCGNWSVLWPQPRSARLSSQVQHFLPVSVEYVPATCSADVCPLLDVAFDIFRENLNKIHPDYSEVHNPWNKPWESARTAHKVRVEIKVAGGDTYLTLDTDESYELQLETTNDVTTATIIAPTFFGARHGLETLLQMVEFHETQQDLMILQSASVYDAPTFKYRGLLLDTSRNFFSVKAIKRTLDAMAANKLNSLHWHITDTHSFPLYLDSIPNMAYYGAYSSRQVYYPADVRYLVQYGRVRGIRVLPEFDAPAHVGYGWQWADDTDLGNLTVCVNREPWQKYCVEPPCGQFNLANPNVYKVLGQIYKEMVEVFQPIDLFHYGGDEVNLNCWNTTEEMTSWMTANNYGLDADAYYKQWAVFQEKSRQLLTTANADVQVPGIVWTSHLTELGRVDQYLDNKQYIIQVWTTGKDAVIGELLQKNYRLIFSNYDAWYLDCGAGAWVGEGNNWCSPYKGWQTVYDNSPHDMALEMTGSTHNDLVLGGEAALWSEQVDEEALDAKLWPRGAALAERLWTNPTTKWDQAELRFIHHRQRLVQRGVEAERIQPQWCHQNEGLCYMDSSSET